MSTHDDPNPDAYWITAVPSALAVELVHTMCALCLCASEPAACQRLSLRSSHALIHTTFQRVLDRLEAVLQPEALSLPPDFERPPADQVTDGRSSERSGEEEP